jgi:uncharacterized protein (TIGR00106 family)
MAVLAELRVIPIATPSTSLSPYVAKVIEILRSRGVKHTLAPFGTCIEVEDFHKLADILNEIVEAMKSMGINRVAIDIAVDVRLDKPITLESKVRSVEEKLK